MEPTALRAFSEQKYRRGEWNTASMSVRSPLLRALWNSLSLKRKGVDHLARRMRRPALVADIGAGRGAYALWFLGRTESDVVAMDWSQEALRAASRLTCKRGRIFCVRADASRLPIKSEILDGLFSIDTLGHLDDVDGALDEMRRALKPGAPLFLHSECNDYEDRWPDKDLMEKLGADMLADHDGHVGLRKAVDLRRAYRGRFREEAFSNPAGYLGWLIGYPEKYRIAFGAARWRFFHLITSFFALVKATPVLGWGLRLVNAWSNRCEVFFGLVGGGSCFALLRKPPTAEGSTGDRPQRVAETQGEG